MKQEIAEYFKTQLRRGNVKRLCLLCLLFISCVNKPSDEKKVEVSGIIIFKVFFMRFHFYEVLYMFSLELTNYKSKLLGLRRKSNSPIIRNPLSL